MADKVGISITVAMLLISVLLGAVVIDNVDKTALKNTEKAKEWCDDRGGELYNAKVIGQHDGLHCELPNGTSVHMHEVITVTESDA